MSVTRLDSPTGGVRPAWWGAAAVLTGLALLAGACGGSEAADAPASEPSTVEDVDDPADAGADDVEEPTDADADRDVAGEDTAGSGAEAADGDAQDDGDGDVHGDGPAEIPAGAQEIRVEAREFPSSPRS
jgi:hypothetical protein